MMRKPFALVPTVLVGSLVIICAGKVQHVKAESPTGSADQAATAHLEALYRLELLPRPQPGVVTRMFSSYDRTGGNNDGFAGTYSKLRVEGGDSVLAEVTGPGSIQRIWFTHSEYKTPGLLSLKREHVRIYLDGQSTPALDVPLEDVFSGKLAAFPKPLVGEALGGFYCYVPIPYRQGCKVVVQGTGVRFYQINYQSFPTAEGIESFRAELSPAQKAALDRAVAAWSHCGEIESLGLTEPQETTTDIALAAGESQNVDLPTGPRMVRAVLLSGKADELSGAGALRLEIRWDGAETPAVDLPLMYLFGQAMQPISYRSLLVGATPQGWYNFMPMPYRRSARLTLRASARFSGRLTLITQPTSGAAEALDYFHAAYRESLPTTTGKYHPFLNCQGRGRYIGTYLVTEGSNEKKLPFWLEGDDQFTVDGELRIHGTGSEDYFNCGWYAVEGRLNGPGFLPQHGFPVYRSVGGREQAVAYRWHVTDPVHFDRAILAEIEHGPTNEVVADYRSAAFYYEAGPEE